MAAAFVASLAGPASACPNCAPGVEARSQVWADGFGVNLLLSLVPFMIIGVASAWANRIGRAAPAAARGGNDGAGRAAPGRAARTT